MGPEIWKGAQGDGFSLIKDVRPQIEKLKGCRWLASWGIESSGGFTHLHGW